MKDSEAPGKTQLKPHQQGGLLAAGAFLMWGVLPIYFKWLGDISSLEVVAHRAFWSFVFGGLLLVATRQLPGLVAVLRDIRLLAYLALTAVLVGANWLVFVWAVAEDRILDASLGYYINPIMNMILGYLILNEKMRRLQQVAAGLAVMGVSVAVIKFGAVPWVALFLAVTFGLYGLIRKQVPVNAQTGLFLETTLMLPLALGYLIWVDSPTANLLHNSWDVNTLLVLAGPFTMAPLILFAAGAKRIQLTTLGFLQYIGPSLMFLIAVFIYGEPLTMDKSVTFGFIWMALVLVSLDAMGLGRKTVGPVPPPEPEATQCADK
ncbi:EamA family transporter RarD [Exilibacterium tricleocarpae]|uniref:EamA family transporter RarD n=1 Tax=Exilibacterium tricleocarpae TaxID=2591008 RepID=A0A545TYV4_9GAMM|nr:EamA family transporter RarD [Exilibacterium tricleocarpae]TQV82408.1 EamA family transporter RarD [Exilibacterium tricleocarpae]